MPAAYQIKDQTTQHYLTFQVVCWIVVFARKAPPQQQAIAYNSFDKAVSISEGNKQLQITYGHHRQRIKQQYTESNNTINKIWAGACEHITENGQQKTLTYLSGPEGVFALHVKNPNGTENIRYIHKDHLGSWHTITDENGNLLQELSFDAWGNRRNPSTWRAFTGTPPEPIFDRGFTGHEHLYNFQLINMNGRMYDPLVSRMLSPDNFIQAPGFSQSFNRYSYVWNNPLVYTDPSGEIVLWAIPYFGIDSRGSIGIGITVGVGVPGALSAQATVGHDFGSNNTHISVGGTASGFTASGGWGTRTGWTASVGVGLGFPVPGLGSNLTSMGWSWSQKGGMSVGAFGFTMDSHGIGFNPSIGYSHSFMYEKSNIHGRPMLASTGDPPRYVYNCWECEYEVIGHRSRITSSSAKSSYWPQLSFGGKITVGALAGGNIGGLGGTYGVYADLYSLTLLGYNTENGDWTYPSSQKYGFSQMNQSLSGGFIMGGEISHTFDGSVQGYGYDNSNLEISTVIGGKNSLYGIGATYNPNGSISYHLVIPVRVGLIIGFEGNLRLQLTQP